MKNVPKAKIGIVAVSRDCFPESLSVGRRKALVDAYKAKYGSDYSELLKQLQAQQQQIQSAKSQLDSIKAKQTVSQSADNATSQNSKVQADIQNLSSSFHSLDSKVSAAQSDLDNVIAKSADTKKNASDASSYAADAKASTDKTVTDAEVTDFLSRLSPEQLAALKEQVNKAD